MQTDEEVTAMDDLKVEVSEREPVIIMTRSFKAPKSLVWKVMTEREHVARWWGLRNATIEILAHDFRVGGAWRYRQEYGGGEPAMIFYGTYTDIQPTSTYTNSFGIEGMYGDDGLHETHALEERGGVTHYTSTSRFGTMEARDAMAASGMEAGSRETFSKLDDLLAELQHQSALQEAQQQQ